MNPIVNKSCTILLLTLSLLISSVQAQMSISDVDKNMIEYKKVVKYLKNNELKQLQYFSEIQPSVNDNSDFSKFGFHTATYPVNASVHQIWNTCINTSPSDLWSGKMLGLSCVYNNNSDMMVYNSEYQFDTLDLNQIYFINLRIMKLFNVAAALMTTKIDYDNKQIEFTYIKGNKSIGKQTLKLIETEDNKTDIQHDTFFKSNSRFRDKRFYARFHQIAITDLHRKIELYSKLIDK